MAMNRAEFKKAFQDVIAMEFAEIPLDEKSIDYSFSDAFLVKMDELISYQKKTSWNLMNYVKRHIAMIAIVLLGLFATACGVTQILYYLHGDLYNEHRQEVEENTQVMSDVNLSYIINELPDGFIKTSVSKGPDHRIVEYLNERGQKIVFLQDATAGTRFILQDEQVISETVSIGEKEVDIFQNNQLIGAMWIENGVYMEILYYGVGDDKIDELKTIIESIK